MTLFDSTETQPAFVAPDVGSSGESLTFQLTVTDNYGRQDTDTCVVNIIWLNDEGGCFISTTAYGSNVEILRYIRNKFYTDIGVQLITENHFSNNCP